ncbi:MAG: DUF488 domain-containing protein [Candidatus Thermoplasmatota archaeon]|nr:DUF488 domain-containing protein [Candidatus Thermoplasmatota archaeon]
MAEVYYSGPESVKKWISGNRRFINAGKDGECKQTGGISTEKDLTIYASGHSTMAVEKFIRILKSSSISLVVDIRTIPHSRHNPQFDSESLEASLRAENIGYRNMKELGGLRKPVRDSKNNAWINDSFRGFADYMQTEEYEKAIAELLDISVRERVVLMCAEGNPFRCHRSLIADTLTARGVPVYHISGSGKTRLHTMTPFARVNGKNVAYPAP